MKWLIALLSSIILGILKSPAQEVTIEKAGTDIDYKPDGIDIGFYERMCNRNKRKD